MARIKSFCKNHIYAFAFFAFLVLYNFVVVLKCQLPQISEVVYSFHIVDYSIGFCSKLLVGAIFNFFYDEINRSNVLTYEIILILLLFVTIAIFCEKLFKKVSYKYRKTALIIIFFFLSGPGTFAPHILDIGSLDLYWVYFTVLFIVCLTNQKLYPLIIVPFVFCVLIHFASLICFIPFFVIVSLYKLSGIEDITERKKLWISLIVSVILAVALAAYFMMFERSNVNYTIEEFHEFLKSKGSTHFRYYDWYLYQVYESELNEVVKQFETTQGIWYAIQTVFQQMHYTILLLLRNPESLTASTEAFLFSLPITVLLFAFIIKQIKDNRKNKIRSFSLVLSLMLFFATPVTGLFFSLDYVRWFAHAFLILFMTCLYICYIENQNCWQTLHNIISKFPVATLLGYFIVYITNTYSLYS
ncbi:MAG: hypothetical protein IJE62_00940 [Clostridia bacterium]|nr:hypothetical protein [Clostridia bacterium]MBQ3603843.1 hypothetical protein [Clostridia bacterium]MBR6619784.1 hypothetical protein [Clostridia bacterium]